MRTALCERVGIELPLVAFGHRRDAEHAGRRLVGQAHDVRRVRDVGYWRVGQSLEAAERLQKPTPAAD